MTAVLLYLFHSAENNGDESLGAPAASVYEGHSGGIVDTLNDLLEKASSQLDEAQKTETTDLNNFQLLKQSLVDEIKYERRKWRRRSHRTEERKLVLLAIFM